MRSGYSFESNPALPAMEGACGKILSMGSILRVNRVICGVLVCAQLSACAYDEKKKEFYPEVGGIPVVTAVREAKQEREENEKLKRGSIHLDCEFRYAGDPVTQAAPCAKVTFVLLNSKGEEVARKIPNADGKLDFTVTGTSGFTIRPDVKKSWKIEMEPKQSAFKAGESVHVVLTP